jgi:DNA-binding protein YbaB
MFDNLMGGLEEQHAQLKVKLAQIEIVEELEGVIIKGNATKEITNIEISPDVFAQDKEMLEDLLITAVNRFFTKAVDKEGEETQKMMSELLPPGFENMFK